MDPLIIIYESRDALLFSQLVDGKFEKKWRTWTPHFIEIRNNATLVYKQTKHSKPKRILDFSKVYLTYIPIDNISYSENNIPLIEQDIGIHITCLENNIQTEIKCVIPSFELEIFCLAIKTISKVHNVDDFLSTLHQNKIPLTNTNNNNSNNSNNTVNEVNSDGIMSYFKRKYNSKSKVSKSVMRRSIADAIDAHTYKTRIEKIITRYIVNMKYI